MDVDDEDEEKKGISRIGGTEEVIYILLTAHTTRGRCLKSVWVSDNIFTNSRAWPRFLYSLSDENTERKYFNSSFNSILKARPTCVSHIVVYRDVRTTKTRTCLPAAPEDREPGFRSLDILITRTFKV